MTRVAPSSVNAARFGTSVSSVTNSIAADSWSEILPRRGSDVRRHRLFSRFELMIVASTS